MSGLESEREVESEEVHKNDSNNAFNFDFIFSQMTQASVQQPENKIDESGEKTIDLETMME